MSFIKGNFKKYIFKSDKGYTVGLFKIKDASEDIIEQTLFSGYVGIFMIDFSQTRQ